MHYGSNEKRQTTPDRRIGLSTQEKYRTLGEKETYKYLGILKADATKQEEMKKKIKEGCFRRIR